MERVVVYSTANCPKCKILKSELKSQGIEFNEMDMASTEAQTELRFNGVFTVTAPILQVDEEFYTLNQIFTGDKINNEIMVTFDGG